jgi:hypothetical protein
MIDLICLGVWILISVLFEVQLKSTVSNYAFGLA